MFLVKLLINLQFWQFWWAESWHAKRVKTVVKQWYPEKSIKPPLFVIFAILAVLRNSCTLSRSKCGKVSILNVSKTGVKKWWFSTERYVGSGTVTQWSLVNLLRPLRRVLRGVRHRMHRRPVGGGYPGNGVRVGRSIHGGHPWYGSGPVNPHCF